MTHPARELVHALRLTFQAIKSGVRRILPTPKDRPPRTHMTGIQSPRMTSYEQGQAWAVVAPDIWMVKRWERRTRRMTWIQGFLILTQLATPLILGTWDNWVAAFNAACIGFIIAAHDDTVRSFAAARDELLKALEDHPMTESRWYDESRLLTKKDA